MLRGVEHFIVLLAILGSVLSGCSRGRTFILLSDYEKSGLPSKEGTAISFALSPRSIGFGGLCPLPSKVAGEANILVVPIEYDDLEFAVGDYDPIFNSIGGNPLAPSSAKEYFKMESASQFIPNFIFSRPLNVSGLSLESLSAVERCSYLLSHELRFYIGTNEAPYPLSLFDSDSDGFYDGLVFLETKKANPFLGGCFSVDGVSNSDCAVSGYACVSPFYYQYESKERTVSFIVHEMCHLMGLADTYAGRNNRKPMGGCTLMEGWPGRILPFEKSLLGWDEPRQLVRGIENVTLIAGESAYYVPPDEQTFPLSRSVLFEAVDPSKHFFAYPGFHSVVKPGIMITRIDSRIGADKHFLYSNKGIGGDILPHPFMNLFSKTEGHYDSAVYEDVEAWHLFSDTDDSFFVAGDRFNGDLKASFVDDSRPIVSCKIENDSLELSFSS